MPGRIPPPRRLRRRLTVAFLLVAGITSGALAAGSFLLVRDSRLDDSLARAGQETRRNLTLASSIPVGGDTDALQDFVTPFERDRGTPTVLFVDGQVVPSNPALSFVPPADLMDVVERGEIGFKRITIGGTRYLVTGGQVPAGDSAADMYFLFSEEPLQADLIELRNVLLVGFGVVLLLAGVTGWAVSGRTLRPVASASLAARSVAEGLLDTRLPVGSRDEFGAWAASFNEMAEALEAKIAALTEAQARERRFTSDVAHELRTPLTALVSEASLLREHLDQLPEEIRRPAELLVADVARLRKLVEDLLEISRLDAGRAAVRLEAVDVGSLVRATIRARGWEGRVRLSSGEVMLETDRRRLERIVANLIGNALEHGGRDVSVSIGRDGTGAFVEVSDRGRGIAPEHLGHLFDRFYKADPARTGPGSGLGLNIAVENARLLGGEIDVWSEVGEGSRFTLRLPDTEPLPGGEHGVSPTLHDEARVQTTKEERT